MDEIHGELESSHPHKSHAGLRVLIATPLYPPEIGGPATYTKVLEAELPKHQIETITVKWGDFATWPKPLRLFAYFLKLHDVANDVDIIYAQDPLAVGLPSAISARLLQKRFFLKVVGDRAWEEEQRVHPSTIDVVDFQYRRFGFKTNLRRFIERRVAKQAECVIVPSDYLQKVVLLWGVAPEKVRVVRNGLAPMEFPSREAARNKLALEDRPTVISIGRLSPWKGFIAVIRAMQIVRSRSSDARLLIIGSGTEEEKKSLEREVATHGLENSVKLVGAVSRETVLDYLAACDVFVLNTFYEGFSHQILEAMAAGAPIVTTAAGGNAEVLQDGRDSRIIPYNDDTAIAHAILELIEHRDVAKRLGSTGKQEIGAYTESKMIEELLKLF